jgi:hypothetical protein
MATYFGAGRSNYVRLKAEKTEEFMSLCRKAGAEVIVEDSGEEVLYGLLSEQESGGLGYVLYPEGKENQDLAGEMVEEKEVLDKLASCMQDREVLIWMHIGNEKMRYLNGFAYAVNNKGESQIMTLHDIYDKVHLLSDKETTLCEY